MNMNFILLSPKS